MRINEVDWGGVGKRIRQAVATPASKGLGAVGALAGQAAMKALGSRVGTDLLDKDKTQALPGKGQLPDWRSGQDARMGVKQMSNQQLDDLTRLPGFSAWSFNKLVSDELARRRTVPTPFGIMPTGAPPAPAFTPVKPAPEPVLVKPGTRVKIVHPVTKGVYYKTIKGWTNEIGDLITDPNSVNKLEQFADSAGKIEKVPAQQQAGKKIKGARRVR